MPTKIKYDLRPYVEAISAFRRELAAAAAARRDFSIKRMFQILPIVFQTPNGRALLEHRGNGLLKFQSRHQGNDVVNVYTNDSTLSQSDPIDFRDDCLGVISTTLPRVMTFIYSGTDTIDLTVADSEITVRKIEHLRVPDEMLNRMFPLQLASMTISDRRMVTRFKDKQKEDFIIDGGVPSAALSGGASVMDKFCVKWQVWSYRNEYQTQTHCKIQRSSQEKPTEDAELEKECDKESEARDWANNHGSICEVVD